MSVTHPAPMRYVRIILNQIDLRARDTFIRQQCSSGGAAEKAHLLLDCDPQILHEMEPISDLTRLRRTLASCLCVQPASVSAHDFDRRVLLQPSRGIPLQLPQDRVVADRHPEPSHQALAGLAAGAMAEQTDNLMLGALIGGRFADRYGRRNGLVISLVTFGLFSIATAYVASFEALFMMRFLTGVGLGGALPNLVAIAAEASHADRRGLAVGTMYAGIPLGGAVAGAVAVIGVHDDWRTIFLVGGILPLLVVPLLLALLPAYKVTAKKKTDPTDAAAAVRLIFGRDSAAATLLLWLGFFFSLLVLYLLLNWLPALLVSRGFAKGDAGIIQIVFNLAGAVGSFATGWALDTVDRRKTVVTAYGALVAALAFLSAVPTNLFVACLAGAFVGAAVLAVQSILYGLAPQCYPTSIRGTGVGMAVAAGRLGSVAGPLLAGGLIASGRSASEVLLGILPIAMLSGVATYVLVRRLAAGVTAENAANLASHQV